MNKVKEMINHDIPIPRNLLESIGICFLMTSLHTVVKISIQMLLIAVAGITIQDEVHSDLVLI